MPTTCIALVRGINVGQAKRVAMAELRKVIESLGNTNVRTVLNSGNVLFVAQRPNTSNLSRSIEAAIHTRFGFSAMVAVLTAAELDAIIQASPFPRAIEQPAKYLVAVSRSEAALAKARTLVGQRWTPEAFAVDKRAAYLWCVNSITESRVLKAFERVTDHAATTRNWATVLKLHAAVGGGEHAAKRVRPR
jgi:uncharacterized protein (DUF1697 family)